MPRILIVDDHSPTRHALARLFTRRGWEVAEATYAEDAIAALVPPPDCALVNVLAGGDGVRVLEAIDAAGLPTRAVAFTGTDEPGRLAHAAALTAGRVLIKPVRVDELLAALVGRG